MREGADSDFGFCVGKLTCKYLMAPPKKSDFRFTGQPTTPPASTAFAIPESIKKLITTKKGVRYLKKILKPVTDPEPRQIIKLGHDNPMRIIRRGPSGLETFLKAFLETLDRYALTEKEAEEMKRKVRN